jgi:hypothetical protein
LELRNHEEVVKFVFNVGLFAVGVRLNHKSIARPIDYWVNDVLENHSDLT